MIPVGTHPEGTVRRLSHTISDVSAANPDEALMRVTYAGTWDHTTAGPIWAHHR